MSKTELMPKEPTLVMGNNPTEIMPNGSALILEEDMGAAYINIGTVLNNKYKLIKVIADNTGEASIFMAEHDEKKYAVKLYHKNKKPKDEISQTLKSMLSDSIIAILDEGCIEERYFEVMPFYERGDLESCGVLDPEFISTKVVPQINEALQLIHSHGIVHRDIKPNNIFLKNDLSGVIIGDFGISSRLESGQTVKATSNFRTIGYSSPESSNGFVSKESDYYSLGVTLLHTAMGIDPFLGMTDSQILKITFTDKLPVPKSIDVRIAQLIKGLTVKDRKDRWGYDEVKRWCDGENVMVKTSVRQLENVKPYFFNGQQILELDDLAQALSSNWNEAIKHLKRGYLSNHLIQFGQDIASKTRDCEEEWDSDISIFKLIYVLNPNAPLCWKGEQFQSIVEFASKIAASIPVINSSYVKLLSKGALLHYLEVIAADRELIDEINELTIMCKEDENCAYYRLHYTLNCTEEFVFENNVFISVQGLIGYIYENESRKQEICGELAKNEYFYAWLWFLGFEQVVTKVQQMNLT